MGISENWYEIVPKSNEKSAVDISGASSNNGANAQIYSRNQDLCAQLLSLFMKRDIIVSQVHRQIR